MADWIRRLIRAICRWPVWTKILLAVGAVSAIVVVCVLLWKILPHLVAGFLLFCVFFGDSIESYFRNREQRQQMELNRGEILLSVAQEIFFEASIDDRICRAMGVLPSNNPEDISVTPYPVGWIGKDVPVFGCMLLRQHGTVVEDGEEKVICNILQNFFNQHIFTVPPPYAYFNAIPVLTVVDVFTSSSQVVVHLALVTSEQGARDLLSYRQNSNAAGIGGDRDDPVDIEF